MSVIALLLMFRDLLRPFWKSLLLKCLNKDTCFYEFAMQNENLSLRDRFCKCFDVGKAGANRMLHCIWQVKKR